MMNRSIFFNTFCAVAVSALLSSCAARKTTADADASIHADMVSATTESGTAPAARVNAVGKIQTVNTKQFNQLLLLDQVQVIDVRTPEEYASGHIEDAVNIDVNSEGFATEVSKLDKEKPVLVYCRSGKRSMTAAEKLREMGFSRIVNLEGGMLGWEEAKMPVKKASE